MDTLSKKPVKATKLKSAVKLGLAILLTLSALGYFASLVYFSQLDMHSKLHGNITYLVLFYLSTIFVFRYPIYITAILGLVHSMGWAWGWAIAFVAPALIVELMTSLAKLSEKLKD